MFELVSGTREKGGAWNLMEWWRDRGKLLVMRDGMDLFG